MEATTPPSTHGYTSIWKPEGEVITLAVPEWVTVEVKTAEVSTRVQMHVLASVYGTTTDVVEYQARKGRYSWARRSYGIIFNRALLMPLLNTRREQYKETVHIEIVVPKGIKVNVKHFH